MDSSYECEVAVGLKLPVTPSMLVFPSLTSLLLPTGQFLTEIIVSSMEIILIVGEACLLDRTTAVRRLKCGDGRAEARSEGPSSKLV